MGFKDLFTGNDTGNYSLKVTCTSCDRITVVKIPNGKTFEKWSKNAKCENCNISSWEKFE